MIEKEYMVKLKNDIENKRERLNEIVVGKLDKTEILKFSQELDVLISEYTKSINKEIKDSRF